MCLVLHMNGVVSPLTLLPKKFGPWRAVSLFKLICLMFMGVCLHVVCMLHVCVVLTDAIRVLDPLGLELTVVS